ncbi:hypothetical protein V1264_021867 [Littorina saxatilis]|uniref:Uncharacterized protein n=1 Tax=Littorina saxatilis TaxID=31220 RepID=A0AAN9FWK3_9CAEN
MKSQDGGEEYATCEAIDEKKERKRFAVINETGRTALLEDSVPKATKRSTKYGTDVFREWLRARGRREDFEELPAEELNELLAAFYPELRTTDQQRYSKSSMACIRAALNRQLNNPPFNRNICLMKDFEFVSSNKMFKAVLKKAKEEGCDTTKHYPNITENDLEKIRNEEAFSHNSSVEIQQKVWFDIQLHFARRGRENVRDFKAFAFKQDDRGQEFVEINHAEKSKNPPGTISDTNHTQKPRMYANGTKTCPVRSLKLYIEKSNKAKEKERERVQPRC